MHTFLPNLYIGEYLTLIQGMEKTENFEKVTGILFFLVKILT